MKRAIITLTFSLFFIFTARVLAAGEGPTGTDAHGLDPAILIGEDEHKDGTVTVRNLLTRTQDKPTRANAADVVRAMLNG